MTKPEELFHKIAVDIPGTTKSKMFGALCIKAANGKAGVMFWKEDMIFKLSRADEQEALSLKGAKVFDPMGGRPMTGWTHVPNVHTGKWENLARSAMKNVEKIEVVKKVKK